MEMKNTWQYLLTLRWQWENEVNKAELMCEAVGEQWEIKISFGGM